MSNRCTLRRARCRTVPGHSTPTFGDLCASDLQCGCAACSSAQGGCTSTSLEDHSLGKKSRSAAAHPCAQRSFRLSIVASIALAAVRLPCASSSAAATLHCYALHWPSAHIGRKKTSTTKSSVIQVTTERQAKCQMSPGVPELAIERGRLNLVTLSTRAEQRSSVMAAAHNINRLKNTVNGNKNHHAKMLIFGMVGSFQARTPVF